MTTEEELDERYGRGRSRRTGRRVFWTVTAVVAVASIGALSWITVVNSLDDVTFDEIGYEVVDDRTVTVSFQVTPPTGAPFACALQALDEDFGIVGWRVIEYPAFKETTRAFKETIPTVAPATTGTVHSCWAV